MNNDRSVSRRNFIKQSSLGLGAGMTGVINPSTGTNDVNENKKLPKEVCVASIDLKGLWPDTTRESRVKRVLERMDAVTGMKPDIICLPELFDTMWVQEQQSLSNALIMIFRKRL